MDRRRASLLLFQRQRCKNKAAILLHLHTIQYKTATKSKSKAGFFFEILRAENDVIPRTRTLHLLQGLLFLNGLHGAASALLRLLTRQAVIVVENVPIIGAGAADVIDRHLI